MKRRIIGIILLCGLSVGIFAGCGKEESSTVANESGLGRSEDVSKESEGATKASEVSEPTSSEEVKQELPKVKEPYTDASGKVYELQIDPATGEAYDLGGMEVVIRADYLVQHPTEGRTPEEEDILKYQQWAQETYNFTIREEMVSATSLADEFVGYVDAGDDGNNYIFRLREDNDTASAMHSGYMYPLSELDCLDFSEEKYQQNKVHEQYSIGDTVYGFKAGMVEPGVGLYFNKRLLEEAGVDPESLYDMQANGTWTWDAWIDILEKVQKDKDGDGSIDVYGYDGTHIDILTATFCSNGAELVGKESGMYTYQLEDAVTLQAVDWYQNSLLEYRHDTMADGVFNTIHESFQAAECAFLVDSSFIGKESLFQMWKKLDDEVGFVVFPKGPKASDYVSCWTERPLVIPACYDKEKAWKIAFAYDVYNKENSFYVGPYHIKAYEEGKFDTRAVKETLPILLKNGAIVHHNMIPDLFIDIRFIGNVDKGLSVDEILSFYREDIKALIQAANE